MEQRKKLITTLSENEVREIEPIIERLNGLEELLMIVTDEQMRDKVTDEIAVLKLQCNEWWNKMISQINWAEYMFCDWEIDFMSKRMWVYTD